MFFIAHCQVITTITLEEPVAGLKGILNFSIADEKSRKVREQSISKTIFYYYVAFVFCLSYKECFI